MCCRRVKSQESRVKSQNTSRQAGACVRTGTFGVNTFQVMPNAPFGGYKMSGFGREGGRETIDAYTETKTIVVAMSDDSMWT